MNKLDRLLYARDNLLKAQQHFEIGNGRYWTRGVRHMANRSCLVGYLQDGERIDTNAIGDTLRSAAIISSVSSSRTLIGMNDSCHTWDIFNAKLLVIIAKLNERIAALTPPEPAPADELPTPAAAHPKPRPAPELEPVRELVDA